MLTPRYTLTDAGRAALRAAALRAQEAAEEAARRRPMPAWWYEVRGL